jgi:hypothetical protein
MPIAPRIPAGPKALLIIELGGRSHELCTDPCQNTPHFRDALPHIGNAGSAT